MTAPEEEELLDTRDEWGYLHLNSSGRRTLFLYLTFPGIVLHELGHVIGVYLAGLRVVRVGWWTPHLWPTAGFVSHTLPKPGSNAGFNLLFIALAPAIVPNLFGVWLLLEASRFMGAGGSLGTDPIPVLLALWIGLSAIYHGIPSWVDFRIAGIGMDRLKVEVERSQAQYKALRLLEYSVAATLYGILYFQQRLFNSFYGRAAWLLFVGWATLTLAPVLL